MDFLIALGIWLLFTAIIIAIVVLFITLLYKLLVSAVIYPRIAFSLLIGAITSSSVSITNIGFVDFALWSLVAFGALWLLSQFPRINWALMFMCSCLITYLVITIVVRVAATAFFGSGNNLPLWADIGLRVVCIAVTVVMFIKEVWAQHIKSAIHLTNPILINVERLVASIPYALGILVLVLPVNNAWPFPDVAVIITLGCLMAAAFVVDIFLLTPMLPASK